MNSDLINERITQARAILDLMVGEDAMSRPGLDQTNLLAIWAVQTLLEQAGEALNNKAP
ncbi:MAG: hypothetical protein QE278_04900 [Limnobacter sp.]|nr:hypothetical protein [Limnobacter sp.]